MEQDRDRHGRYDYDHGVADKEENKRRKGARPHRTAPDTGQGKGNRVIQGAGNTEDGPDMGKDPERAVLVYQ